MSSSGSLAQGISNFSDQLTEEDGVLHGDDKDVTEEVGDGDGEQDTTWLGGGDAYAEDKGNLTDSVIRQGKHCPLFNI